ncbi:MAG: asparagine synthase-related protein [Microthrixaceae bacterium]
MPFLDVDLIEAALAIPVGLRRPGVLAPEKGLLRAAVEDLLPQEVVWRDKSQFDQGTGTADLLEEMATEAASHIDVVEYSERHPETHFRSSEECRYHEILVGSLADPGPTLDNVALVAPLKPPAPPATTPPGVPLGRVRLIGRSSPNQHRAGRRTLVVLALATVAASAACNGADARFAGDPSTPTVASSTGPATVVTQPRDCTGTLEGPETPPLPRPG